MPNNRIFYAVKQVGVAPEGSVTYIPIHGAQSCSITTAFNLTQVFELGQISLYENIENIPDVTMSLEKVLDGYPLIYHLATNGSSSATLSGRSAKACNVALGLFGDTQDAASGTPISVCQMSGMFCNSVNFNFVVDGNCTEQVELLGTDKVWTTSPNYAFSGAFTNTDAPIGLGGVNQRQDVLFKPTVSTLDANSQVADPNCTILPGGTNGVQGISSSGTNFSSTGPVARIQRIGVSVNLGRESLFELGRRSPYYRFVNFPVEVTCEIEQITTQGDLISATEAGYISAGVNLTDKSIRIATREGTRLNLGTKNKLSNVTMGGGDAGGGNETVTYTYTNFNDMTCTHSGDCTTALRATQYIGDNTP